MAFHPLSGRRRPAPNSHGDSQFSMGRAVPGNATAFLAPPLGELLSEAKLRGDTKVFNLLLRYRTFSSPLRHGLRRATSTDCEIAPGNFWILICCAKHHPQRGSLCRRGRPRGQCRTEVRGCREGQSRARYRSCGAHPSLPPRGRCRGTRRRGDEKLRGSVTGLAQWSARY